MFKYYVITFSPTNPRRKKVFCLICTDFLSGKLLHRSCAYISSPIVRVSFITKLSLNLKWICCDFEIQICSCKSGQIYESAYAKYIFPFLLEIPFPIRSGKYLTSLLAVKWQKLFQPNYLVNFCNSTQNVWSL